MNEKHSSFHVCLDVKHKQTNRQDVRYVVDKGSHIFTAYKH